MPEFLPPPPRGISWGGLPDTRPLIDDRCRAWSDDFETLPRSRWRDTIQDHLVWHIYDQLDGMCTSNAGAAAVLFCRELAGQEREVVCPSALYGQHSRWGTGSTLAENVAALLEVGIPSAKFVGREQPWPMADLPAGWQRDAARFRILPGHVWNLAGSFDRVATAIQRGFAAWIGVRWPGGGGHSVLAVSAKKVSGVWRLRGPNSWGGDWNGDGFWELTEAQCGSMGSHGAYAVQQVMSS